MNRDDPRDRALEELIRRQGERALVGPSDLCVDADTLAAWVDGALTGDRLAAAEAHAAGCARCQALLAAMVRTSPAPEERRVRWHAGVLIRWGTPLAAAAALILWVSIGRQAQPVPPPVAQTARQPAEPAAPAPAAAAPMSDRSLPAEPATRQARAPKPESPQERPVPRRREEAARVAAAPSARPTVTPPTAVGGVAPNELRADAAARSSTAEAVAVAPPPPPAVAPAGAGGGQAGVTAKRAFASVPLEVISPDRSVRWRTSGGSAIERSGDGGATWTPLPLASPVVFTAGASPSPDVCWLVGPAGTVFLTTDGRTFRRLRFPETANLVTIRATDARSATVTTADGRRFATADGGETWTLQETPAAPF